MQEKVTQLLQEALEANPSLFLIDLSISEDAKIRVILDGDQGVKVEDCIAVSRAIEHNLDREELDFSLEVMSAGATEPLTLPRQYVKNVTRKLAVKTVSGETIEATLVAANEDEITLQWKAREPKPIGKGKITVEKEAVLGYSDIVEAKVMIKFN